MAKGASEALWLQSSHKEMQSKWQVSGDHRPRQDPDVPSVASGVRWYSLGPTLAQAIFP